MLWFVLSYMIFQNIAIILTLVPYVISIKNTSVLMSVLFGWLIFREEGIRERLAGTAMMVLG
jgi:uncharacterized membrane protein